MSATPRPAGKFVRENGQVIWEPKFNQGRIRNLNTALRDIGYRFGERDLELTNVVNLITDSGLDAYKISQLTAADGSDQVSPSTIGKWLDGTVKNPRNSTVRSVLKALGVERPWIVTAERVVADIQVHA